MKNILYGSAVGSLVCAQTCSMSDITFYCQTGIKVIEDWITWKLQREFSDTYKEPSIILSLKQSYHLEVIGCLDSDFAGCADTTKI